jgi:hypothetical protein
MRTWHSATSDAGAACAYLTSVLGPPTGGRGRPENAGHYGLVKTVWGYRHGGAVLTPMRMHSAARGDRDETGTHLEQVPSRGRYRESNRVESLQR